jgi:hypothetical protein
MMMIYIYIYINRQSLKINQIRTSTTTEITFIVGSSLPGCLRTNSDSIIEVIRTNQL